MKINEVILEYQQRPSEFFHVTLTRNVESILKHGLKPQSGERSELIDDYGIFLFDSEHEMDTALGSWFGEILEEQAEEEGVDEIPSMALKVVLPSDFPVTPTFSKEDKMSFEWSTETPIPPKYITVFKEV